MIYILQIFFVTLLLLRWKGGNNCYKILVVFQLISFTAAPIVSNEVIFETPLTFFNTVFCFINLYLIISPWRKNNIKQIYIKSMGFMLLYKKCLYIVLSYTIINNLIVLIIINLFIPDIALFKAASEFKTLYDNIPYFGIMFRYASVSRYIGLLALPICFYYMRKQLHKQAGIAFLMSSSTLIAAIAFYSRAQILSYSILYVALYFYLEQTFDESVKKRVRKLLRNSILVVVTIFIGITVSRFGSTEMSYYGDRIPEDSYVKNQILYSVFDYSSQGFPNGIMQLEVHNSEDVLDGEPLYSEFMMMLSYFNMSSWDKDEYAQRLSSSYNKLELSEHNDLSAFHGYTCSMVKMMGYIFTLLFNIAYYIFVCRKSLDNVISIQSLSVFTFLLLASINSIFYCDYATALYPLIFYFIIYLYYNIIHCHIVI